MATSAIAPCLPRPELFSRHIRTWDQFVAQLGDWGWASRQVPVFLQPPRPGDLGSVLRSSVMHGIKWVLVLGDLSNRLVFDALRAGQLGRELAGCEVYLTVTPLEGMTRADMLSQLRRKGVELFGVTTRGSVTKAWDASLHGAAQALVFIDNSGLLESDQLELEAMLSHRVVVPNVSGSVLNMPTAFESLAYEHHRQESQSSLESRSDDIPAKKLKKSELVTFAGPLVERMKVTPAGSTLISKFSTHPCSNSLSIGSWNDFLCTAGTTTNLSSILVLCASQHAGNLGSALQSSAAHMIDVVIVLGEVTSDFVDKAAQVAQLACPADSGVLLVTGAADVPIADALTKLHDLGFQLIGFTESETSVPVWVTDLKSPRQAFVFGRENGGIPDDASTLLDVSSTIPQMFSQGTLNVSAAVEAVLFERHRQLHKAGS